MRCDGHDIINYTDIFVSMGMPTDNQRVFQHLFMLLCQFSLDVCNNNLVTPGMFLGITIDSVQCTTATPPEKLKHITDIIDDGKQEILFKNQLQSLLGHLLYIHKCENGLASSSTLWLSFSKEIKTMSFGLSASPL